jgi:hypothetical protein
MSAYEFGESRRKFRERHADLAQEPAEELSDDALYQHYEDVVDGTAGRRQAERNVKAARQEKLEYWRHQYELGRPLPRDLQEELGG